MSDTYFGSSGTQNPSQADPYPGSSPGNFPAGSPEWWRERLLKQLSDRARHVDKLERYYRGDHPLPKPPERLNERAFQEALRAFKSMTRFGVTNWVKLVADGPSERLSIVGFRHGDAVAGFEDDKPAWLIWQRNQLDADAPLVHDNALQSGNSFAMVWPDPDTGKAVITPEHSGQMIIAYVPGSRRQRAAALKMWLDDSGRWMATLYLPGEIYKWQTASTRPGYGAATMGAPRWLQRQPSGEEWPITHPWGVPVVEFRTNPGLKAAPFGGGCGEFEPVLTIQDRINKTIFDRLVTAEYQAFRQRYILGWTPKIDPVTKKPDPREIREASQSEMWTFPKGKNEMSIGELGQADFTPFIKSVEADVNAMAAITKTPPQYLLGAMINISGEALTAAESGLVAKVLKHSAQFGESWEEVIRLALTIEKDARASDVQSTVVWRDPQFRSLAELADALTKLATVRVPDQALWQMVLSVMPGLSQQDINNWPAMQAAAALLQPGPAAAAAALAAPVVTSAG